MSSQPNALAVAFGGTGGALGWPLLWWLLPLVPIALVIRAVFWALARSDECQRQLQLEGLAPDHQRHRSRSP